MLDIMTRKVFMAPQRCWRSLRSSFRLLKRKPTSRARAKRNGWNRPTYVPRRSMGYRAAAILLEPVEQSCSVYLSLGIRLARRAGQTPYHLARREEDLIPASSGLRKSISSTADFTSFLPRPTDEREPSNVRSHLGKRRPIFGIRIARSRLYRRFGRRRVE